MIADKYNLAQALAERTDIPVQDLYRLEEEKIRTFFNKSANVMRAAGQRVMGPVLVAASIGAITQGAGLLGAVLMAAGGEMTWLGVLMQRTNRTLAAEIRASLKPE